ncbi:ATP-binding protein [Oleiagrimonas sp. C23AA]|uniref:ATP-binding protein n=1 Tax=Oleiagrimonas sp. C23AA TaxID=2719047 RepID=UPI00141DC093|nr:ATP-binding protein [Oleiagrimonas sp. C23AA]NII11879.1 GHKL domain-containing protein [Oleiagrimonas sp. C23AA]
MKVRRPLSLTARSTLATILVLVAFLGLTGFSLERAYQESALSALQDRLQSYVYAYLASTDVGRGGRVLWPDSSPHSDFLRPGSGLYAIIDSDNGAHWESPSAVGRDLPFQTRLDPNQSVFTGPIDTSVGPVYIYSLGVAYDAPDGQSVHLTFNVAQTQTQFLHQLQVYRRTLFIWLAALGVVLVLLQLLLLRWSLSPLRRVSVDLAGIERGERERLEGRYPVELVGLTRSLNDFIESEREHMARYRNTLADLAHSLKTPLAVVRSRLDMGDADAGLRNDITDQVRRMDEIVAYQLSRAATSGGPTFAAPILVGAHAEDLVRSLEKVHAAKGVLCEFDIDEEANFYGERGDLLELLGNLLENAFKWARHRVMLRVHVIEPSGHARRAGMLLAVEDDGPGIPSEKIEHVLQRGVRGDERVQGHGIGLAIVQDIVRAYRASLVVEASEELGGSRFLVRFEAS